MTKPKVSVIIPVYNAHDYLERCLDSVINQTLKEIEIICVDDCSKDNSLEILNRYSSLDSRIKVIPHTINQGESVARNTGIDSTNGEYIAFLDNDDEVDLNFYEKLYAKAIENSAEIVVGNVEEIDYYGKRSYIKNLNKKIKENSLFFVSHWWRAIYKRDFINTNNIRLPIGYPLGGDLLFLNQAVLNVQKISTVDDVYYHYYRREDSGDSKVWTQQKFDSAMNIYRKILDNLNNSKIYEINMDGYMHSYFTYATGPLYAAMHVVDEKTKRICVETLFDMYKNCKNTKYYNKMLDLYYPIMNKCFETLDIEGLTRIFVENPTLNKFNCKNRVQMLRQNISNKKLEVTCK